MNAIRNDLDHLHRTYARSVDSDPIYFAHQFKNSNDREIVAFISAMFAFGNVKAIFSTLRNITFFTGDHPYDKLLNLDEQELKKYKFAKHRWIKPSDTQYFLRAVHKVIQAHGTLEKSFLRFFETQNFSEAMNDWMEYIRQTIIELQRKKLTRGQKFLLASPKNKSASKRLMMFFRWMVRTEFPDLGLWKNINPSELFIPLDRHLFQFSQHLKFTKKKQANWQAVIEITEEFKKICPEDPIRYDFSLAQLGIRKICIHKAESVRCNSCIIQNHCDLFQILGQTPNLKKHDLG